MKNRLLENLAVQKKLERQAADYYSNMLKSFSGNEALEIKHIIQEEIKHERLVAETIACIKSEEPFPFKEKESDVQAKQRLAGIFESFSTALCTTNLQSYVEVRNSLLRQLVNRMGKECIYITLNSSEPTLKKVLQIGDVQTQEISFINATFSQLGEEGKGVFVSPKELTQLGIQLSKIVEKKPGAFVFFDPVSVLSIYHKPSQIQKFVKFLNNFCQKKSLAVLWIALKVPEDSLNSKIAMLCEKTFDLSW